MLLHRKNYPVKALIICFLVAHGTTLLAQGGWTDGADVVYTTTAADRVGIGTGSPVGKLVLSSEVAYDNVQFDIIAGGAAGDAVIRFGGNNGGVADYTAADVPWGIGVRRGSNVFTIAYQAGGAASLEAGQVLSIETSGNVGIGTTTVPTGYKLAVDGKIIAEEVHIDMSGAWPDDVFREDYNLMPLAEVAAYIASNGHLPEVPSAEEVAVNGLSLGATQALLLKKIEELTLYMIQVQKENEALREWVRKIEEN